MLIRLSYEDWYIRGNSPTNNLFVAYADGWCLFPERLWLTRSSKEDEISSQNVCYPSDSSVLATVSEGEASRTYHKLFETRPLWMGELWEDIQESFAYIGQILTDVASICLRDVMKMLIWS